MLEKRLEQLDEQVPELQGEFDFLKIQYLSGDDEILDEVPGPVSRLRY